MNSKEISELCIESCEKYYKFLKKNGLGEEKVKIVAKNKLDDSVSLWQLHLGSRVFNCDLILIRNCRLNILYNDQNFEIEYYDIDTNRMVIRLKKDMESFEQTHPNELLIISDLKFLVENLRNWFLLNWNCPEKMDTTLSRISFSKRFKLHWT